MLLAEFFRYQLSINESAGNIVRLLGFNQEAANEINKLFGNLDFTVARLIASAVENWEWAQMILKEPLTPDDDIEDAVDHLLYALAESAGIEVPPVGSGSVIETIKKVLNKNPKSVSEINSAKIGQPCLSVFRKLTAAKNQTTTKIMDLSGGWSWVDLGTCNDAEEAAEMQHCGADNRGNLVSLRTPEDKPAVTMTYNKEQNLVFQIKGKQNAEPIQKYWSAVKSFFEHTDAGLVDSTLSQKFNIFLSQYFDDRYNKPFIIALSNDEIWFQENPLKIRFDKPFLLGLESTANTICNPAFNTTERIAAANATCETAIVDGDGVIQAGSKNLGEEHLRDLFIGLTTHGGRHRPKGYFFDGEVRTGGRREKNNSDIGR